MSKHIDKKDFALAVVSGNPVSGNSPEEIAKKALELYQTAIKVADEHNKLNRSGMKVLK
ncbi:hypothetical protein MKY08_17720 [Lysinibacillus sp. FSL M8-0337]|uniref:hypothetical protein n=1 Tax=Lysinibacillus TaxID=400634 RepID=UPI000B00124A|nr:hypothetical protein [Lysinibacillus sphaericus]